MKLRTKTGHATHNPIAPTASTRLSGTGHGDIIRTVALVGHTLTRSICSPNPALNHPRIISETGCGPSAEPESGARMRRHIATLYISRAPILPRFHRYRGGNLQRGIIVRSREVDNTVVAIWKKPYSEVWGGPNLTLGHPETLTNIGPCPDWYAIRVISPNAI